ncbi:hypothetical protein COMNV_00080 [Commensalibacter sp. Nvir]|uniref:succinate dehydrogenase, hydrophobic membrane anchor protein n=1 Tax=Commensalibacter sp. Nvir TaxID=3069817 RepID=UPI002D349E35|nr:hypothetical protein COMNV_00080 [Commensalibacter sp. Nvir]
MIPSHQNPRVMRSHLGRVRCLGVGHNAFEHWWTERLCATGMAPLSIWFIIQLLRLSDAEHKDVVYWAKKPINSVLLLALVLLTFNHMRLGLSVITEDYTRGKIRMALNLLIKGCALFMGLLTISSILKLMLTSPNKL